MSEERAEYAVGGDGEEESAAEVRKPEVQMTGTDGNVFAIIGRVSAALRRDGQPERAEEWKAAARACESYDAVLQLMFSYVDPS